MKRIIDKLSKIRRQQRKREREIEKSPRYELLNIIGDAVRDDNGCHCLKRPVLVFVDEIFGEIPLVVRCVKFPAGSNIDVDEFDVGNGYTTLNIDSYWLREIAKAIIL